MLEHQTIPNYNIQYIYSVVILWILWLNFSKKLSNRIRNFLFKRKQKQKKSIVEIFDVVIYSSKWINIINQNQKSYLVEQWGYKCDVDGDGDGDVSKRSDISRNHEESSQHSSLKDSKMVDINHPEYQQIHLFRFEKSNRNASNDQNSKFIITDIDLSLDGNISLSRFL